jgi:hypothetical protein
MIELKSLCLFYEHNVPSVPSLLSTSHMVPSSPSTIPTSGHTRKPTIRDARMTEQLERKKRDDEEEERELRERSVEQNELENEEEKETVIDRELSCDRRRALANRSQSRRLTPRLSPLSLHEYLFAAANHLELFVDTARNLYLPCVLGRSGPGL